MRTRICLLLFFALPAAAQRPFDATIYRDRFGVPHIYGESDADAVFGLAYAMAEDNFWQFEEDYIWALGRAAELYGPMGIPNDLATRAWQKSRRARDELDHAPAAIRRICAAFAAGYNAWVAADPSHKPRLIEKLEPWHVLAYQDNAPGLFAGGVRRADALREFPILSEAPAPESNARGEGEPEPETDEGSNMWAVSAKKSASGNPLFFCNPHVGFFGAGQRYEAHLDSPEGLKVFGFAILGTPFIRSGFTPDHGWCHTNNNADLVDLYAETFDKPESPLQYKYGSGYRDATAWEDEIFVKQGGGLKKHTLKFRRTHHGPILGVRDGKPLAVRRVDSRPANLMAERIAFAKSRSLEEFRAALQQRAMTGSNTLYADTKGNIFYLHGNAIPRRDSTIDWTRPVDGSSVGAEWEGLYPFDALPQFLNPESGFLQNCNSSPVYAAGEPGAGAEYPDDFVPETDNFRAKRSRQLLTSQEKFTFKDWRRVTLDTGIYLAQRDIPYLMEAWPEFVKQYPDRAGPLKDLVEELRKWDRVSTVDSVAMTLFMKAFLHRPATAGDQEPFLMPDLLEKAKADLEKSFSTWRVPWGDINRLQRIHTSGRLEQYSDDKPSLGVPGAPGAVGVIFNFYTVSLPGLKRSYGRGGNSWVGVAEMRKKPRFATVRVLGQSADPASPHFMDQARIYAGKLYKDETMDEAEIRKKAESRIRVTSVPAP